MSITRMIYLIEYENMENQKFYERKNKRNNTDHSNQIISSLAKLRDDIADAILAVSLANALQDVLDAVDHLLS